MAEPALFQQEVRRGRHAVSTASLALAAARRDSDRDALGDGRRRAATRTAHRQRADRDPQGAAQGARRHRYLETLESVPRIPQAPGARPGRHALRELRGWYLYSLASP